MANTTVNKVVLGDETLLDLTGDTATAADVAQGKTFHLASGVAAVGTASGGGTGVSVFYGTCATAAATAAKVVVCDEFTSADLVEGTVINVKFTYAQTYNGAPTLDVQSTGAKNVKRVGTTNAARYEWLAGEVLQFVYDGTYWMLTDGGIATTTYYGVTKLSSSTSSTSNALAATASAVKAAYDLADGKQDALVSGTNIKTINNESLLGSGDLTVGGSVSMEDTAVDAAVEAAWPAAFNIIDSNHYCRSITTDGSYGSGVTTIETEATSGSTVTVAMPSVQPVVSDAGGSTIQTTYVDAYLVQGDELIMTSYTVYSFTMPDSDATISV